MKSRLLVALVLGLGITAVVVAAPQDMEVYTWDPPDCEHTMTTNHFELGPGQTVEFPLDLTACKASHSGILFFGYHTTRNRSRQFTSQDNIRLTVVDRETGDEWSSDSGFLKVDSSSTNVCMMRAENMNRK